MIAKQDIDNVKSIIQKTKRLANTEVEKLKFDKLFQDLELAGKEFIKEVTYDVRLS